MSKYFLISVDIEAAGPNPSSYSLLTIGACTLESSPQSFYIELKPVNLKITPEAFEIHHLDLKHQSECGEAPEVAMAKFEAWIKQVTPEGQIPLFLAFNAPFDWMFVCDYFHRFLRRNPFGHAAVDIKAFAMGAGRLDWDETTFNNLSRLYLGSRAISHHAQRDALDQAEIFNNLMTEFRTRKLQGVVHDPT
jgi:DNA polymerase III epsilon subunit-like protein